MTPARSADRDHAPRNPEPGYRSNQRGSSRPPAQAYDRSCAPSPPSKPMSFMAMWRELLRRSPARQPAVLDPLVRRLSGPFNELLRLREIEWRHREGAQRRHNMHVEVIAELLDFMHELPIDHQREGM